MAGFYGAVSGFSRRDVCSRKCGFGAIADPPGLLVRHTHQQTDATMIYARPTQLVASMSISDLETHAPLVLLLGLIILSTPGCTSSQRVSHDNPNAYRRVSRGAAGHTVRVTFRDRPARKLEDLYVGPSTTTGLLPSGDKISFPTSSIRTVERVDHVAGFGEGVAIGFVGPFTLGFLHGRTADKKWQRDLAPLEGILLGLPGALIGGILGAIGGHQETYHFQDPSPVMDSTASLVKPRVAEDSPPE